MALPDRKDYALSRASILTEGYKGLLAVHGGAIAAMLAFASQVSGRSQALTEAVFISLGIFAFGLTVALLIPFIRVTNSKAAEDRDNAPASKPLITVADQEVPSETKDVRSKVKTVSWITYTVFQYLSVAAFLAGTGLVAQAGYSQAAVIYKAATPACK